MQPKYIGPPDNLEWIKHKLERMVSEYGRYDNLEYIFGNRYGDPTKKTKTKKIWKQPKWTISIIETTKTRSLVWEPECDTIDEAYDLIQDWCREIGLKGTSEKMSGREEASFLRIGLEAIRPYAITLNEMSSEDMKNFVLRYLEGLIFTSQNIDTHSIHLVFMPLVLGGLSVPDDVLELIRDKLPPDPGEKPEEPEKPAAPTYPEKPVKPVKPAEIQPDPEKIALIENKILWQEATAEARQEYLEEVSEMNQLQDQDYARELKEWRQECQKIAAASKVLDVEAAERQKNYLEKVRNFKAIHDAWVEADLKYSLVWKGVIAGYTENVGIIWEDASQAGPRSINGYPIFFSMKLMSKSDWDRAKTAILKESKRRERMYL